MRKVCRVFEDVGGWYFCDEDNVQKTNMLDTRGRNYKTPLEAKRAAKRLFQYTHAFTNGRLVSLKNVKEEVR